MRHPPTGGSLPETAVQRFHDLVLADPPAGPWFAGVDLRAAHTGLGIDDAALDRLVAHLAVDAARRDLVGERAEDVRR